MEIYPQLLDIKHRRVSTAKDKLAQSNDPMDVATAGILSQNDRMKLINTLKKSLLAKGFSGDLGADRKGPGARHGQGRGRGRGKATHSAARSTTVVPQDPDIADADDMSTGSSDADDGEPWQDWELDLHSARASRFAYSVSVLFKFLFLPSLPQKTR